MLSANGYRDLIAVPELRSFRCIPWESNVPFFLVSFLDPDTRELVCACPRGLLNTANVMKAESIVMSLFWFPAFLSPTPTICDPTAIVNAPVPLPTARHPCRALMPQAGLLLAAAKSPTPLDRNVPSNLWSEAVALQQSSNRDPMAALGSTRDAHQRVLAHSRVIEQRSGSGLAICMSGIQENRRANAALRENMSQLSVAVEEN